MRTMIHGIGPSGVTFVTPGLPLLRWQPSRVRCHDGIADHDRGSLSSIRTDSVGVCHSVWHKKVSNPDRLRMWFDTRPSISEFCPPAGSGVNRNLCMCQRIQSISFISGPTIAAGDRRIVSIQRRLVPCQ